MLVNKHVYIHVSAQIVIKYCPFLAMLTNETVL